MEQIKKEEVQRYKSQEHKIVREGYIYTFHSRGPKVEIWRCIDRKCYAKIHFVKEDNDETLFIKKIHSCELNSNEIKKLDFFEEIFKLTSETEYEPKKIYELFLKNKTIEDCLILKKKTIFMRIYNLRKKQNLNGLGARKDEIPEMFKKTLRNENFLIFDSGMLDEKRMIILGTQDNLKRLESAKIWLGDGTFKSAPESFTQIYILYFEIESKVFPAIYCFLKGKSEELYWIFFKKIYEILPNANPIYFVSDHESAVLSSFNMVFPNSNLKLCLFHFGQSIWRYIQKIGLSSEYYKDERTRLMCKMLTSLTFVPNEKVPFYFEKWQDEIKTFDSCWKLEQLASFFCKNYIKNTTGVNKIDFWNSSTRIYERIPLTTNALESFNAQLNLRFNSTNPSILTTLTALQNLHNIIDVKFVSFLSNPAFNKKNLYSEKIARIQRLIFDIERLSEIDFLKAVSYIYNWKFD